MDDLENERVKQQLLTLAEEPTAAMISNVADRIGRFMGDRVRG